MTFADMRIFEYWKMTKEPAVLIGMDALGTLADLDIDYQRKEVDMLSRTAARPLLQIMGLSLTDR